jgi:hypothetical protein
LRKKKMLEDSCAFRRARAWAVHARVDALSVPWVEFALCSKEALALYATGWLPHAYRPGHCADEPPFDAVPGATAENEYCGVPVGNIENDLVVFRRRVPQTLFARDPSTEAAVGEARDTPQTPLATLPPAQVAWG